jgi:hypothetical protein
MSRRMNWKSLPKKYQKKEYSKKVYKPESGEKEAKLIIPGKLPNLNDLIGAALINRYKYNSLKSETEDTIRWYIRQQKIPFFKTVKVKIIYYRESKREDPGNITGGAKKVIMDALVDEGVIKDDGWKYVKGFEESWEKDKNKPRTEVILKEGESNE